VDHLPPPASGVRRTCHSGPRSVVAFRQLEDPATDGSSSRIGVTPLASTSVAISATASAVRMAPVVRTTTDPLVAMVGRSCTGLGWSDRVRPDLGRPAVPAGYELWIPETALGSETDCAGQVAFGARRFGRRHDGWNRRVARQDRRLRSGAYRIGYCRSQGLRGRPVNVDVAGSWERATLVCGVQLTAFR